ncbi:MAG TPA: hypothetical protein VGD31_18870 [Sphingobacteriaceae bacterium]
MDKKSKKGEYELDGIPLWTIEDSSSEHIKVPEDGKKDRLELNIFECRYQREDKSIKMDKLDYITKIYQYAKNENQEDTIIPLIDGIIDEGKIIESIEDHTQRLILKFKRKVSDDEIRSFWLVTDKSTLYDDLKRRGLLLKHGEIGRDAIAYLITKLESRDWLKSSLGYGIPAFYEHDGEIRSEYIEIESHKSDLSEAIETLEEFINDISPNLQSRADYIFLPQLTVPFDYVRKQKNLKNITALLLTGESEAGKTTIANATSMLYKIKKEYQKIIQLDQDKTLLLHGGNVGTPARYGHHLRATTLPIVIDEAEDLFQDERLLNMTKQIIDSHIARTIMKRDGVTAIETRAYTTPIFIMNEEPTTIRSYQGLLRRLKIIRFKDTDRIDNQTKQEFKQKWKVTERGHYHESSPLRRLWHIGAWTYKIIKETPELLEMDRIQASETILMELYRRAGIEWESSVWNTIEPYQPETVETVKFNELVEVINFLKEMISKGWDRKKTIRESDDYYSETRDEVIPIEEKALNVAKGQIYPWIAYNDNQNAYIITKGFTEDLKQAKNIHLSLARLRKELNAVIGSDTIMAKSIRIGDNVLYGLVIPKEALYEILNFVTDIKPDEDQTKLFKS